MKRNARRSTFFVLLAAGVLLALAGCPALRRQKEAYAARDAVRYLARNQLREASVSARLALHLNPSNLEASKVMARLADLACSPKAIEWHLRVTELEPAANNQIQLAASALHTEPPLLSFASKALEAVSGKDQDSALFHSISAELALKTGDSISARSHLSLAAVQEPTNKLHRLNLAVLDLRSTKPAEVAGALNILEGLRTDSRLGLTATRSLVSFYLAKGDHGRAGELALAVLGDERATFQDRLLYVQTLCSGNAPDFQVELATAQTIASTNTVDMARTVAWMRSAGLLSDALAWIETCPTSVKSEPPASVAVVECLVQASEWADALKLLQSRDWKDLEFLRLAFLSRVLGAQRQPTGSDAEWRSAVRETHGRLPSLLALHNLAVAWDWQQRCEEVLWKITTHFSMEGWARKELHAHLRNRGDTAGLRRFYAMLLDSGSTNSIVKNNYAITCLLLRKDVELAHQLAREAYQEQSDQLEIVATHAFSLFLQGGTNEAMEILEGRVRNPSQEVTPDVCLYLGFLLSEAGQSEKALSYLARAKGAVFLPEEMDLLKQAIACGAADPSLPGVQKKRGSECCP